MNVNITAFIDGLWQAAAIWLTLIISASERLGNTGRISGSATPNTAISMNCAPMVARTKERSAPSMS